MKKTVHNNLNMNCVQKSLISIVISFPFMKALEMFKNQILTSLSIKSIIMTDARLACNLEKMTT